MVKADETTTLEQQALESGRHLAQAMVDGDADALELRRRLGGARRLPAPRRASLHGAARGAGELTP